MLKIGIECESIEDQTWGVGRIVTKLIEDISDRPELAKEFKFFLYFKSKIPNFQYLQNPIFVKKIVKPPLLPPSFSLYYYLLLPLKLYFENLDAMFFPNYMLPLIFKGKSLVMLTEDIFYEFSSGTLPLKYKLAYKIFAGWAAKHATRIMAISETSKREVSKLFEIPAERISVNQLGVDCPNKVGIQKSVAGNYLLYVGQAFPRRHLKETILAFEKITPLFPDLKLVAIGKDKYNPSVINGLVNEVNKKLGVQKIIYKEYVPDEELAALYMNAKLLIYVSSKEAFGLPPLEALAYGTAPVVALEDVTKEIFGKSAFFVENPDDTESIARALTSALNNEKRRQEIIDSAGAILQKYTWPAHTDRFLDIVRGISRFDK